MSLTGFLQDLLNDGCATLEQPEPVTTEDRAAAAEILQAFECCWRMEFPGDPPPLSLPAAVWAAEMLFRACQCLMFRAIDADGVRELLGVPYSGEQSASEHYSVDLTFQLLPDVVRRAENVSRDDPLLAILREWAGQWPLSSVGLQHVQPQTLQPVVSHPGLRRLYVDRILQRNDYSRLNEPQVVSEIRTVLGAHHELAPKMLQQLESASSEDSTA